MRIIRKKELDDGLRDMNNSGQKIKENDTAVLKELLS